MLRDQQVLEHRHAGEQADVLEGAGDARLLRDLIVRHALEQEQRAVAASQLRVPLSVSASSSSQTAASPWRSAMRPSVGL